MNASPLLIALTGGIASGKSAVAELFARLGVPVLDADRIAREVVEPGKPALNELIAAFGADILDTRGHLDRIRMRERIFTDAAARNTLETILHPVIRAELLRQSESMGGEYQIHVIPLLVEGQRSEAYDRVLVVDSPEEAQITRLMARDHTTREQAARIVAAQATREQRLAVADDVIVNTGTLEDLQRFVQTLHRNYSLLAQKISQEAPPAED